ncbi:unnamed protein product [Durusdinium trenchii]|uniref:UBA domain-containing protein n=1 Tax=Durusdinium trenchii TaxID=1381693 RepID=A0ABP0MHX9_9DINO
MQDGDLCIFGTQRHGVPVMPEISEGRITLVVFFYPNNMQKKGMWQTITDPETMAPSAPLGRMLHDEQLNLEHEKEMMAPQWEQELSALQQLGFSPSDAWTALRTAAGDADAAAELLLLSGAVPSSAAEVEEKQRGGRFQKRLHATSSSMSPPTPGPVPGTSSTSTELPPTEASTVSEDEELAMRLSLMQVWVSWMGCRGWGRAFDGGVKPCRSSRISVSRDRRRDILRSFHHGMLLALRLRRLDGFMDSCRQPSHGSYLSWIWWLQLCDCLSGSEWQEEGKLFRALGFDETDRSGDKTLAVKVPVLGCFSKPCWLQSIRVGIDETNSVSGLAKDGSWALGPSETLAVPTSLSDHAWLAFPLRGHDKELRTLQEVDHVWLVLNTDQSVKLTYENANSLEEATRYVSEDFAEAFALTRQWEQESGRQWGGHFRNLRMQMDLGDVSILPGSLPLILEAPHGGRIYTGWPQRSSGVLTSDQNTDVFAEALWSELGLRCGRFPRAVILRVKRQGVDANRATGTTSTPGGEDCSTQSNGECCCDLPDAGDQQVAMELNDVYHSLLADEVAAASDALLVAVHATGRHRVEVGVRLSATDLNQGAGEHPPSLQQHDSDSSLRALGGATELVWGSSSLGHYLKTNRPSMGVVPSPTLRCPDDAVCPGSSYSSLFMGGHNLKIHVSNTQAGIQLELPQVMRGYGSSPPMVEPAAVKQVAAALASFLNAHYQETCETDVNFGLSCSHGEALQGVCVCDQGYVGETCGSCAEGYLLVGATCQRLVIISPPAEVTQKYGSAFVTTSSGKKYLYTRKFATDLEQCGAPGCRPLNLSVRIRCDSDQCHNDVDGAAYTMGGAVYDAAGQQLCNGTISRTAQAETDWWLQIPLHSCPVLQESQPDHGAVYLSIWTSKLVKVRWEQHPSATSISRGLQYKTELFQQDPTAHSSDGLVDAVPPSQLPSWKDLPCTSASSCSSDDSCDCISGCTCRSWSGDFYGLMEPEAQTMSDAEVAALVMQLEELEAPEVDPSLLVAQFQEYQDKSQT